jgi:hypothetical protein
MNSNVNRLSNTSQFVQLPQWTRTANGDLTMDIEMPETALIDRVEVVVTSAFPANTTVKVGNPTTADAYLASAAMTAASNTITTTAAKRFGALTADRTVRVTVTGAADLAAAGSAYIRIWHVFTPNTGWAVDPEDATKYILQPSYLYL